MVALYRDISTDEPRAIHRTALREDGLGKADHPAVGSAKQMLGPIRSSAIKLTSDEDVTSGLHIAEGIESGLTAMLLGLQPVWVMGSAAQISRFPVLAGLESLTVLADHDPAGHSAASDCARKYSLSGKEARVLLPPKEGTDWNDYAAELKGRYV
jgi:hypothetical protein